jgi:hypothetical protein
MKREKRKNTEKARHCHGISALLRHNARALANQIVCYILLIL